MAPPRKPELRESIVAVAKEGVTMGVISQRLQLPLSTVIYHIRVAMAAGELPRSRQRRHRPEPTEYELRHRKLERIKWRHKVVLGSMSDLVAAMSEEQADWVMAQVPDGSTVADFLRSLVVDAMEEGQ
jgi:transposase